MNSLTTATRNYRALRHAVTGIFLAATLAGCYTTTSDEPEKWSPQERAEAHVNLGMNYLRRNQLETARYEFDLALEINPDSDTANHAKGLLLTRMGDPESATRYFRKATTLNPQNYIAANDYGIHLCQSGDADNGARVLRDLEQDPQNTERFATQLGLGVCLFEAGRYAQASGYLREVLEQSPTLPQALLPMAEISYNDQKMLSSRAFLERYFGSGAISERSLYLAARVEYALGDLNKANQYRRELNRRYPGSSYYPELESLLVE